MIRILLLAASIVLAGCPDDVANRSGRPLPGGGPTETPNNWTVLSDNEPCACTQGRSFYLANMGHETRSISIVERWNNIEGGHGENNIPYNVPPGWSGRKKLKCSPDGAPRCNINYSWIVDGVTYNQTSRAGFDKPQHAVAGSSMRSLIEIDAEANRIASGDPAEKPNIDCLAACSNKHENCLFAPIPSRESSQIREFVSLVESRRESGFVPVEEILRIFDQKENVCERTDLSINDSLILTNTGSACQWTAGTDTAYEMKLIIPDVLSGVISPSGAELQVTFPKAQLFGPSIHFIDPENDRDYGGAIYSIQQTTFISRGVPRSFMIVTGRKSCLALQMR